MSENDKKQWLLLSPHVYVNTKNEVTLLYNTKTGDYLETDSPACRRVIDDLQRSENLGTIELSGEIKDNPIISGFIAESVRKSIMVLADIEPDKPKPMVLLPILNLQRDVDKFVEHGHDYFIGMDVLRYLHQMNIHVNDKCDKNCNHCRDYYKQSFHCTKHGTGLELSPKILLDILSQAQHSLTRRINMTGGNIMQHSRFNEILDVLDSCDYDCHLYISQCNIPKDKELFERMSKYTIEMSADSTISHDDLGILADRYEKATNVRFNFPVESEQQYRDIEWFTEKIGEERVDITPFYTGNNDDFFQEYIYVEKDDILGNVVSMRTIFCNQKLNSNYFGILSIAADGIVRAGWGKPPLGNIHEKTILEMIYDEILSGSSWRNVRDCKVCSSCLYQFFCPPPSNYEYATGKENLCKVTPASKI